MKKEVQNCGTSGAVYGLGFIGAAFPCHRFLGGCCGSP